MDNEFIGAIKIKDGLFIGDEYAAQDLEFIVTNKVTHIINCAGRQLANYWESLGVIYLTYDWLDSQNQIVFDQKGEVVNEIYNFIEEAHANADSVLVHSERGQSRSCCVIASYFMKRFNWSLYKTLEFLASRRPDLEIRDSFYYQLVNLESKLIQQSGGKVSSNWNDVTPDMDIEEVLLRNTFLNARNAPLDEQLVNPQEDGEGKLQTINWGDEHTNDVANLAIILTDEHIMKLRLAPTKTFFKSILKGSNKIFKHGKQEEQEQQGRKGAPPTGLRLNKSLKTLHEEKGAPGVSQSATLKKSGIPTGGTRTIDLNEKPKSTKVSQSQHFPRSSSASNFEKDGVDILETPSPLAPMASNISGRGDSDRGVSKVTMNLAANNFLGPLTSVNNVTQTSSSFDRSLNPGAGKLKQSGSTSQLDKRGDGLESSKGINSSTGNLLNPRDSLPKTQAESNSDRDTLSSMSTKQLKLAIEKKYSKQAEKPIDASAAPTMDDVASTIPSETNFLSNLPPPAMNARPTLEDFKVAEKPPRNTRDHAELRIPKPKEYTRPTDIKVNYQVLLKNRETPPPRQREEAKKNPESVYKKALAKSSLTNIRSKENTLSNSASYLQNLFPTSATHLNSYTPSGISNANIQVDKRTPATTKATSSSQLNFGKFDRPLQTVTNSQNIDKTLTSPNAFDGYLKTNVTPGSNQANQPYSFKPQLNNFMAQQNQAKNIPVKASHEKRPRSSGSINRPSTPNSAQLPSSKGSLVGPSKFDRKEVSASISLLKPPQPTKFSGTPYLRSFSPCLRPGSQQMRRESPSAQAGAKYRQRSSSPAQNLSYNNLFNTSATSSKPKWKF